MAHATAKTPLRAATGRRGPQTDRKDSERLYQAFRHEKVGIIDASGEARHLPDSLHAFLSELIGVLDRCDSAMIVRDQAQVTTIEAASLLGVSRQFLVNLLEKDEMPYHMVGTHRRIYARDLFRYKAQRDGQRHKIIRDLAQAEAEEGLYDRQPAGHNRAE